MLCKIKRLIKTSGAGQKGSAMILVLLFMALAGLAVPPMLSYMSTGLKTGMIFKENTRELYAAESGVNDGLWYVSYSSLNNIPGGNYKEYDFSRVWSYTTDETVNDQTVDVSIQNVWIPKNIQPVPSESQARSIAESGKLLVTSSANATNRYQIETVFYPNADDELDVESLGIWLPPGFTYVSGSSDLEAAGPSAPYYPHSVEIVPYASGQVVIWHFLSLPFDQLGPYVEAEHYPITSVIAFDFVPERPGTQPMAITWMTTSGVLDVPFSWDADIKVYRIEGQAGGQNVQVYATRSEMRQLGSSVKGDYVAIGNVLETATGDVNYRNRLLKESSASVESGGATHQIPSSGTIRDAWLYWSGYIYNGNPTQIWYDNCSNLNNWETSSQTVWQDSCSSLNNWSVQGSTQTVWSDDCSAFSSSQTIWTDDCSTFSNSQTVWSDDCGSMTNWSGSDWGTSGGQFRGHHSSGDRYLTRTSNVDLSAYAGKTVTISWSQSEGGDLESSDVLRFSISNNGGSSWSASGSSQTEAFHGDNPSSPYTYTIPSNYLTNQFRIRFYLDGFNDSDFWGTEYAYIDNIVITVNDDTWTSGGDWDVSGGQFRGHHSSGDRYLTRAVNIDLSAYTGQTVTISWSQGEGGTLESDDTLRFSISNNGGSTWSASGSSQTEAFHDDNPSSPYTYTIPGNYLTSQFKIRFYLDGFNDSDYYGTEYAYIDNITIATANNNWTSGGDWDVSGSQFRGHHSSGDRYLTRAADIDLSAYAGQTVTISWSQGEGGNLESSDVLRFSISNNGGSTWSASGSSQTEAFHDDNPSSPYTYTIPGDYLTSQFRIRFYLDGFNDSDYYGTEYAYIDNISIGTTSGDWDIYNNQFRGHHASGDRYLTRSTDIDLSDYAGQIVTISWNQSEGGDLESNDILRFSFSNNSGYSWSASGSSQWEAFRDDDPTSSFSYTISSGYLTSGFRIRFYLDGFNETGEYAYIDNIRINVVGSGDWDVYNNQFRGHHGPSHSEDDRYLTLVSSIDLSSHWGNMVTISWKQSEGGNLGLADGLKFYVSKDGGSAWAGPMEAFHDDNPSSPFYYTIPNNYLTDEFRIKFYLDRMSGDNQYAYLDDITITANDMNVGSLVFNGHEITADEQQFKEDTWQGNPTGTYSYSCSYDATDLVNEMIDEHTLGTNGSGTYTVGHILTTSGYTLWPDGKTEYPLAIPSSTPGMDDVSKQYTYAAWSLILIYTSPETLGHQLYLYDDFNFVENDSIFLDISGFLAPDDPSGSSATFFVGEGDYGYTGDGVRFNGHSLSDGINPANNIWNSYSNALPSPYINGIDLDTFDVSSYIHPQDTYADVELYSTFEIYNVIYVILSFRNDSEFGGIITYLIGD